MLDFLRAEHDKIEKAFQKKLGPAELLIVRSYKLMDTIGQLVPYGLIIHPLDDNQPVYINPALDKLLGYAEGQGPSKDPMLLAALMRKACCMSTIDRYTSHFNTRSPYDLDTLMRLECADGTHKLLAFQSHAMQGFRQSPTCIVTLVTALSGDVMEHPPVQPCSAAEAKKLYATYLGMSEYAQLTMYYLTVCTTKQEVEEKIDKSRASVNLYIREIKDAFNVEKLRQLILLYGQFSHLYPERVLVLN